MDQRKQDGMKNNNQIKNNSLQHDEYFVKDIGEAAVLLCRSVRLLRLQKENTFYWFVFSNRKLCEQISNEYWFGSCLINAKTYNDFLRTLKDRVFAQR